MWGAGGISRSLMSDEVVSPDREARQLPDAVRPQAVDKLGPCTHPAHLALLYRVALAVNDLGFRLQRKVLLQIPVVWIPAVDVCR